MGTLTLRFKAGKNSKKNMCLNWQKYRASYMVSTRASYIWLQISFFLWFQTHCKKSFFSCPFWSEIWIVNHQNWFSMVEKLQLFHSQRQISLKTSINVVFRHSWTDIRVAISQKVSVRILWYVPHFEGFSMPVKMQYEFWMETDLHL